MDIESSLSLSLSLYYTAIDYLLTPSILLLHIHTYLYSTPRNPKSLSSPSKPLDVKSPFVHTQSSLRIPIELLSLQRDFAIQQSIPQRSVPPWPPKIPMEARKRGGGLLPDLPPFRASGSSDGLSLPARPFCPVRPWGSITTRKKPPRASRGEGESRFSGALFIIIGRLPPFRNGSRSSPSCRPYDALGPP